MDRLTGPTGPRCRCGESVPKRLARVFGVDGVVPVCRECYISEHQGRPYDGHYAAIRAYRQGTGRRRIHDD